MRKKIVAIGGFVLLLTAFFWAGTYYGYSKRPYIERVTELANKETGKNSQVDFSPFWKVWSEIDSKYVSAKDLDNQKRVWGSIEGMVKSLKDPYSVFFPPQEAKTFEETIRGDFGGVGMEIGMKNDIITVVSPLKDSPAYKAGIKSGDRILKIDDKTTNDMTVEEAVQRIRGEVGTKVNLVVLPKDQDKTKEFSLIRDTIKIPVLETSEKPGGIFVISMYNFSGGSMEKFREALKIFVSSGKNKLILDLRGNPGGYLESAVDVSSWFLPSGKTVVIQKDGSGDEKVFRSKGYDIFRNLPMVILVNEGSASASEITAGALQEHGIAKLVGAKTFGKGSVQELIPITPDTSLKLTTAKWLTPNGRSISDHGLEPDYKVEFKKEDLEAERDPQMEKAIEVLKNWK